MVCGSSLFQFWKLDALTHEFQTMPKAEEHQQRVLDMRQPSWHFVFFCEHRENDPKYSSWELADSYHASYCSDSRDRVFALLPLADLASREMFQPDYTKSVVEIVLQLLRSKAKSDAEDAEDAAAQRIDFYYKDNFKGSHLVIGSFGLGPEDPDIAAMLKQRVSALQQDLEVPATRECRQSMSRHNADRLNQRLDDSGTSLIVLAVRSHCTISTDHAGGYFVPLSRLEKSWRANRHDGATRSAAEYATRLRGFDGTVVGLVSTEVQHGDTLLLFDTASQAYEIFHAGLIVRRFLLRTGGSVVAKIIGQCLVDFDVEVCQDHSACECEDHGPWMHVRDDQYKGWKVHMSPEDLLLFIAQDLKVEHRQAEKFVAPMVDLSAHVDESSKRLQMSVTREELSSYAVVDDLRPRRPRRRRMYRSTSESSSGEESWERPSESDSEDGVEDRLAAAEKYQEAKRH